MFERRVHNRIWMRAACETLAMHMRASISAISLYQKRTNLICYEHIFKAAGKKFQSFRLEFFNIGIDDDGGGGGCGSIGITTTTSIFFSLAFR